MESDSNNYVWTEGDKQRVVDYAYKNVDNPLIVTKKDENVPTWYFYERWIHIMHGDLKDLDFNDFERQDFREINWTEIGITLQKLKGEDPEEYDPAAASDIETQKREMTSVRDFLLLVYGSDFGIPKPEDVFKRDK